MPWTSFAVLYVLAVAVSLSAQPADHDTNFASLQGRAVNEISGEPIAKAAIHLSLQGVEANTGMLGRSDAEGRFRFKHVPPGRYNFSGEKSGFIDTTYDLILSVQAGDQRKEITLKLERKAAITGRVLDEDGDPVPDAEVKV